MTEPMPGQVVDHDDGPAKTSVPEPDPYNQPPPYVNQPPPQQGYPPQQQGYPPQQQGYPPQQQGYPPQQQGYPGGTTVIVQQTAVRPASYLALAVLTCIFCNFVLGIAAIVLSVLSSSSADEGDLESAKVKGKISCGLSLGGMAITILSIIIVIIVIVTAVDDAVNAAGGAP